MSEQHQPLSLRSGDMRGYSDHGPVHGPHNVIYSIHCSGDASLTDMIPDIFSRPMHAAMKRLLIAICTISESEAHEGLRIWSLCPW
eukprot:2047102-Amphidinium_carterae.1